MSTASFVSRRMSSSLLPPSLIIMAIRPVSGISGFESEERERLNSLLPELPDQTFDDPSALLAVPLRPLPSCPKTANAEARTRKCMTIPPSTSIASILQDL
jgi:hypothetical protein